MRVALRENKKRHYCERQNYKDWRDREFCVSIFKRAIALS